MWSRPLKRRGQHTRQPAPLVFLVVIEAQRNFRRFLSKSEGTEESIPDGKETCVVRVRLWLPARVMHVMHPRRDDEPAQAAVGTVRDSQIAVMEKNHRERDGFVNQELRHSDAD